MTIEVYEHINDNGGWRMECRTYELPEGMARVLIDKSRRRGAPANWPGMSEVWAFDADGHQHEGKYIDCTPNVVVLA